MITIDGKIVKVISQTVEKETDINSFLAELMKSSPMSIPILPDNVRGFATINNRTAFIVEQFPCCQSISYKSRTTDDIFSFSLNLPYTYFIIMIQNNPIVIDGVGLFYAKDRIISADSDAGFMSTPNVSPDSRSYGHMCIGEINLPNDLEFHDCVQRLISQIWGSNFNRDHFNPQTHGLRKIHDVICPVEDFTKLVASKGEIANRPLMTQVLNDENIMYLWKWDMLSRSVPAKNFYKDVEFPIKWKYNKILDSVGQFFRES